MKSSEQTKTPILIADDHLLFVEGIRILIDAEPDLAVVAHAPTGADVLPAVQQYSPRLILLDVNLPRKNGRELAPLLLKNYPSLRVVILTMYAERRLVSEFQEMGVHGYLLKNVSRAELLLGIRTVLAGGQYLAAELSQSPQRALHADDLLLKQFQLTPRELAIIRLIVQGLPSQEIADKTGLSYLTIKTHRRNIHFKLGTSSTADLIRFAVDNGI